MKRKLNLLCSALMTALLGISAASITASAAEPITATIPVTVTVAGESGTLASDIPTEEYTFVLTT